jgi:putative DNA primase/helicase
MLDYARGVPGEGYTEREALASLQQAYKASRREAAHLPGIYSRNGHQAPDQPPTWGSMPAEDLQPDPGEKIHLTDQGNARRFALQHGAKVKYTKAWGWLIWDGRRWCDDETGLAMRLAKQTVKQLYREAEQAEGKAQAAIKAVELAADRQDPQALAAAEQAKKDARRLADALLSWAIKSQGAARLEAILTLAKSEPEIAARVSDFDNDPWLLNCENGLLDLRNAQLKPHDPSYKVTKLAGTLYDPAATCPTWLAFLARIFDGDQKTIAFLQRAAGYSLTGDTGEQCLFFSFGKGANGKSTFMNAMQAVLADYAAKIRAETILVKKLESIPEDVARLAGVRFALSAELTEGRLNEGLVKDLTGGDKQAARFLYQKTFEFWPTLKLWMYGNEKPTIAGQNDGIWRRIRMIPFEVTIPEPERDSKLPEKLRAELPGILAWAVRGCLEWQRAGLQPTEKINQATREYREEQDLLGQFFAACCVFDPPGTQIPHSETSGDLLEAFKQFTGFDMKPQTFSKKMRERGFKTSGRDPSGRALYSGIKLLPTTANP